MKILIMGVSSLIGSHLARHFRKEHRVYGTYAHHRFVPDGVTGLHFVIHPKAPLQEFVKFIQPDVVFYCVSERDLKKCAENPLETLFLHGEAAEHTALNLAGWGGRLVYFSTSKVYDGEKGPYVETDPVHPNTIYGKTKVSGENMLTPHSNTWILRLGTVFGTGPLLQRSMLNRFFQKVWAREDVPLVSDEYRSFVPVSEVVRVCERLLQADPSTASIYNVGNSERHTYYTFARAVAQSLRWKTDRFIPVKAVELAALEGTSYEPGEEDLTLSSEKLEQTFQLKLPELEASLVSLRNELQTGSF